MNVSARSFALALACLLGTSAAAGVAETTTATNANSNPPTSAAIAPAPGSYSFQTELTDDRFYSGGAYEGVLNLKLGSDGTLNGTYRAIDSGTQQTVTGGFAGDKVWLSVGFTGFHVDGAFIDGRIVGYTHLTIGTDQFRFEANPAPKQL